MCKGKAVQMSILSVLLQKGLGMPKHAFGLNWHILVIIKLQILRGYFPFYSDQLINYHFASSLLKILIKLLQQESNDQRRLPSPPEIEYGDWSAKKVEETEFDYLDYLDYLDYINYLDDTYPKRRCSTILEILGSVWDGM